MTQLLHKIGEASTELPTGQALTDRRERPQQPELGITDGIVTDVIVAQPTFRLCQCSRHFFGVATLTRILHPF